LIQASVDIVIVSLDLGAHRLFRATAALAATGTFTRTAAAAGPALAIPAVSTSAVLPATAAFASAAPLSLVAGTCSVLTWHDAHLLIIGLSVCPFAR
jgi:hypothetical protein